MKNSKEYAQKMKKLYKSLRANNSAKVQQPEYEDPTEAMVFAAISEFATISGAKSISRRMSEHFVDLNDLRVAPREEVLEILGDSSFDARQTASQLNKVLNNIFISYNTISLMALKKMGKRPAKQVIEKITDNYFVTEYCFLTALEGHSIPLTPSMVVCLKKDKLVYPDADADEIEGFLARQISAKNAYEFYSLLRGYCESRKPKKKVKKVKKAVKKKVVKKETVKKKTVKKKTKTVKKKTKKTKKKTAKKKLRK